MTKENKELAKRLDNLTSAYGGAIEAEHKANSAVVIRKAIKAHRLLKTKKIVVGAGWVDVEGKARVQAFNGPVKYYVTIKGTATTFPCKNIREVILTLIGLNLSK